MNILLVEDDQLSGEVLAEFLEESLLCRVTRCDSGIDALELLEKQTFPIVISDIRMPGISGVELLKNIKENPDIENTEVILITGHADVNTAIQALRNGAFDLLRKPIVIEELAGLIRKIEIKIKSMKSKSPDTEMSVSAANGDEYGSESESSLVNLSLTGGLQIGIYSDAMRSIIETSLIFHSDRSAHVLIEGETGTGKEVVAKAVHYGDSSTDRPFISINCSAISPNLFESELFGYAGGAFTGAKKTGDLGKFELAQGGTLFLDEIADLPMSMQPKLLRALQEKEIYRVGGIKPISLDVRIIAATNRNLEQQVTENHFRKDLYYRLNLGLIRIPPLRQQKEAIIPLAQMFLSESAIKKKHRFRFIGPEAKELLEEHTWLGNIRELENTIERVVLLYDHLEIRAEHLSFLSSEDFEGIDLHTSIIKPGLIRLPENQLDIDALEAEIVRKTMQKFQGNKTRTAKYLGVTLSALRSRLKRAYKSS